MQTSYFARSGHLKNSVSIALKCPPFYKGREYKILAPQWWFLKKYKEDHDETYYMKIYRELILKPLDPIKVFKELGVESILLCWEGPGKFCHRRLVAEWFNETLGLIVPELV